MRKIKYICTLLLSLPFLLSGCETVVELDLPTHEPQLVVNAVINPDNLFTVDVSASRSPFSNEPFQQLTDAKVQVYQAGQVLFDLQHMGNGIYKADTKPQALQHYELQVSAPGFPNASATSYIPAAPVITNIEAQKAPFDPNWGLQTILSFELNDVPEQENFYYVEAYTPDTSFLNNQPYNRYVSFRFTAPIEQEFRMENRYFFSDRLFKGQLLPLTLNLENNPEKTTYVQVVHITKEYYEYVRTLDRQAGGDDFGNFPTQVTNNIRNGFGLFAGYNAVTLAVKP